MTETETETETRHLQLFLYPVNYIMKGAPWTKRGPKGDPKPQKDPLGDLGQLKRLPNTAPPTQSIKKSSVLVQVYRLTSIGASFKVKAMRPNLF